MSRKPSGVPTLLNASGCCSRDRTGRLRLIRGVGGRVADVSVAPLCFHSCRAGTSPDPLCLQPVLAGIRASMLRLSAYPKEAGYGKEPGPPGGHEPAGAGYQLVHPAKVQARRLQKPIVCVRSPPATSCSISAERLRTVSRLRNSFRLTLPIGSFVFILLIFVSS